MSVPLEEILKTARGAYCPRWQKTSGTNGFHFPCRLGWYGIGPKILLGIARGLAYLHDRKVCVANKYPSLSVVVVLPELPFTLSVCYLFQYNRHPPACRTHATPKCNKLCMLSFAWC